MSPLAACSWGVALGALAASSLFAMTGSALRHASLALSFGILLAFVLHEAIRGRARGAIVVRRGGGQEQPAKDDSEPFGL